MNLQQRLDSIRLGFAKQAPPEAVALMNKVTDDLRNSGIMDRAIKEGQKAHPFELENSHGRRVSLRGLLGRGPVVLTFFRGHW